MPIILWSIFVVALIPLAAAAHHLIEKPARNLLRRGFPGFERPFVTVS
jgi:peptidoglycan/LPS O-acetylase OafA/YrhL